MASFAPTRRHVIGSGLATLAALALAPRQALAAIERIVFDDLYGKISVLGLSFSDKAKALAGQSVEMRGFMAPPLKAEAKFFVLTEIPMSLCPFCSSDADWPANIVVVYLREAQTFEQANKVIEVSGRFEIGSWTDPETGFVSLVRIVDASFRTV
ncbi:hypothetical protein ACP4J4_05830 [Aureimonas ureilytica]|uniref:hypothetical protein n=1 Tax=Aureimonas ureilytica TaxID=401562 RepID=UPI003CFB25E5